MAAVHLFQVDSGSVGGWIVFLQRLAKATASGENVFRHDLRLRRRLGADEVIGPSVSETIDAAIAWPS